MNREIHTGFHAPDTPETAPVTSTPSFRQETVTVELETRVAAHDRVTDSPELTYLQEPEVISQSEPSIIVT